MFILVASSAGGNRQTYGRTTLLVLSFVYFSSVFIIHFENVWRNAVVFVVCVGDGVGYAAASNMSRNCHHLEMDAECGRQKISLFSLATYFQQFDTTDEIVIYKTDRWYDPFATCTRQTQLCFLPGSSPSSPLLHFLLLSLPAPTSLRCSFCRLHPQMSKNKFKYSNYCLKQKK